MILCLKEKAFRLYLEWKSRPQRLRSFLKRKNIQKPSASFEHFTNRKKIRAAAVQLELSLYKDPLEYAREMSSHVEKAAGAGANLIAFPENNGLQLLGMLPGIEEAGKQVKGKKRREKESPSVLEILNYTGPIVQKIALETFSCLARNYHIYIMAGSFMHPVGEKVVNRSYLFNPEGRLLGTQDKVHLFPTEKEWGLSSGDKFEVFPTPIGVLAMPVCMDATYFETFRILSLLGAEIVILPIANAEPYNYYLALRGIWPRVQESLVYGIKSALVGSFLNFTFTGKAGIYAPLEISPARDGVLAETKYPSGNDLAIADLDLEALQELRSNHPYLGDLNLELYSRYFPSIYEQGQKSPVAILRATPSWKISTRGHRR